MSAVSAVYSPDLDKNIAFGMVAIGCAEPGSRLVIDMGDQRPKATVTGLPFIDNRAQVWKGTDKGSK